MVVDVCGKAGMADASTSMIVVNGVPGPLVKFKNFGLFLGFRVQATRLAEGVVICARCVVPKGKVQIPCLLR